MDQCNLLVGGPFEHDWHAGLCTTCPVPQIKRANNCATMQLNLRIIKRGLKFWAKDRIVVQATCSRSDTLVVNPLTGCGLCHTPLNFVVKPQKEHK